MIDKLIDPESVKKYWEALSDPALHQKSYDVVNYVFAESQARFVFVIIVLINEPQLLLSLIRDQVCDDDLPLSHVGVEGVDFQLAKRSEPNTPVECFTKWTGAQRHSFDRLQRQVKAQILQQWPIGLRVTQLSDLSVLPFTKCVKIHNGNSTVYRVEIHHAHHRFKDDRKVTSSQKCSH